MTYAVQSLSIVAGTPACNAACYFCVSKMTTSPEKWAELEKKNVKYHWRRHFKKAVQLAHLGHAQSAIITGKGEPTLFPNEITEYLEELENLEREGLYIPFKELNTNGTLFGNRRYQEHDYLREWYEHGLDTVILSVVSVHDEENRRIYLPDGEYPSLERTINEIHRRGLQVRLGVVGLSGYVDTPSKIEELVSYAKRNGVEQLTWRPVTASARTSRPDINERIARGAVSDDKIIVIDEHVKAHGTKLRELMHGGAVYDLHGQNLCLTTCLTNSPKQSETRQLIFYPTGEIRDSWQYDGSTILGKAPRVRRLAPTPLMIAT